MYVGAAAVEATPTVEAAGPEAAAMETAPVEAPATVKAAMVKAGAPIDAAIIAAPPAAVVTAAVIDAAVIGPAAIAIAIAIVRIPAVGIAGIGGRLTTGERDGERRNDRAQKNPTSNHGSLSFASLIAFLNRTFAQRRATCAVNLRASPARILIGSSA
jgi:hypothetical protein